jgi:hypothetical protein
MINKVNRTSVFFKTLNKNLFVNFITLADEEWINERYPNDTLLSALQSGDSSVVLDIFWRLLDNDSKKLVSSAKLIVWDGMEEKILETKNPAEKLKHLVSGADEIKAILEAIFKTKENSNPEVVATSDEKKKNPTIET